MNLNLKDKIVVITGGTSGIGKATAFAFANEGATVIVCSRSQTKINKFLSDSDQLGYHIEAMSVDISNFKSLKAFIDYVGNTYGRIDVLFNNAAQGHMDYLTQLSLEDWNAVISSNLTSAWLASKYVVPYMKKKRRKYYFYQFFSWKNRHHIHWNLWNYEKWTQCHDQTSCF